MKRVGYATGVFDLFHIGHLNILKRARLECDYLIVGVTTDELAEQRKGRRPVIPFIERMSIVEALKYVDEVVPQAEIDELADWRNLKFDCIFKGSDWQGTERWNQLERTFADKGVEVVFMPYTDHTSSSFLRSVLDRINQPEPTADGG